MNPLGWLTGWLGNEGERTAARYLKQHGFRIVLRQARSRIGEIDLIARDGDTLVFIEVKTRRGHREGSPSEAVDLRKQKQMTRAALAWLKQHRLLGYRCRFDVVAIRWSDDGPPEIVHFRNAFEAVDLGQMY